MKAVFVVFVKRRVIAALMDVCWLRESVLALLLHGRVFSHSAGLRPRLPTRTLVRLSRRAPKQWRAAVLLHGATDGQSPGGGVFSDKSVPNLLSELNCVFVTSYHVNVSAAELRLHGFS